MMTPPDTIFCNSSTIPSNYNTKMSPKSSPMKQRQQQQKKKGGKSSLVPNSSYPQPITIPLEYDVLCIKDKTWARHEGNRIYREKVLALASKYEVASKQEKMALTRQIVYSMQREYNSRFLRLVDEKKDLWEVITDKQARDKTSHALRFAVKSTAQTQRNNNDSESITTNTSRASSVPSTTTASVSSAVRKVSINSISKAESKTTAQKVMSTATTTSTIDLLTSPQRSYPRTTATSTMLKNNDAPVVSPAVTTVVSSSTMDSTNGIQRETTYSSLYSNNHDDELDSSISGRIFDEVDNDDDNDHHCQSDSVTDSLYHQQQNLYHEMMEHDEINEKLEPSYRYRSHHPMQYYQHHSYHHQQRHHYYTQQHHYHHQSLHEIPEEHCCIPPPRSLSSSSQTKERDNFLDMSLSLDNIFSLATPTSSNTTNHDKPISLPDTGYDSDNYDLTHLDFSINTLDY